MLLASEAHRSNQASPQINDPARRIITVSHGIMLGDDIAKGKPPGMAKRSVEVVLGFSGL